jgi:hypothetical protein
LVSFFVLLIADLAHPDVCSVRTDFSKSEDTALAVTLQSDGKIVVAGGASGYFAIIRYNTDGSLDPTFGGDGRSLRISVETAQRSGIWRSRVTEKSWRREISKIPITTWTSRRDSMMNLRDIGSFAGASRHLPPLR